MKTTLIEDRATLFSRMPANARSVDLWKVLESLSMPMLLIEGEEDAEASVPSNRGD